ncbi:MAG TPA: TonB-dependent siderophore receptor [Burkholderiales bacterium]|jgi:iron complex outermembrane recepter protein|nr:TonB-dependent siderophore receptor [Burkholderiales bacterium]
MKYRFRFGPDALAVVALALAASSAYAQETQLQEVKVTATASEESATGPVEGYVPKKTRATKTETPLAETAQSISVITRDRMEAQNAMSMIEALRYTAGVYADAYGLDSRGDWPVIRGSEPVDYLDGLQRLYGFTNNVRLDTYAMERIEVLRGPSSALYGQATIAGIVNAVSKRPVDYPLREIQFQYGSFDRKQAAVDLSGSANEQGTLLYRLVALGKDGQSQVDYVNDTRHLLAPSLTFRPSTDTELTILANFQKDDTLTSSQFFPHAVSRYRLNGKRVDFNNFVGEPGFDRYDSEQSAIGYEFSHRFNDTWRIVQNLRYNDSEVSYRNIYPTGVINGAGDLSRVAWLQDASLHYWVTDTRAESNWKIGETQHQLVFGVDWQRARMDSENGFAGADPINAFNPVYTGFTPPSLTPQPVNHQRQTGLYVQDQMKYERWTLGLGLRRDLLKSATEGDDSANYEENSKRFSVMYGFANGISPYINYSESFVGQGFNDVTGSAYKPLRGKQYEAGVKYEPKGVNGLITAAVFHMVEENRLTQRVGSVIPGDQVEIGEAEMNGLEVEAIASLNRRWDVIANYTYLDTEITESNNPAEKGARLASIPEHMASLWSTYKFSIGDMHGFKAGGGVRYVGSSWDGNDDVKTNGVTLFDAMLGYESGPWHLALNATNLFDKFYLTTCRVYGDCFIGQSRTVTATATYRF